MTDNMPKEAKHALNKYLHKKELHKMEGVLYKYRNEEIDFDEFIKRLKNIREFYTDD